MLLVHFEVELDFAREFCSYSVSQRLHRALTGTTGSEGVEEPGVQFRSTKRKQLVSWDTDSCRVVLETMDGDTECIAKAVALLETINEVAPIGDLSRREVLAHWILPAEKYNFKSLEQKYRDTFINPQLPWKKNVFDSSVIFDIRVGDTVLHHQSGAMKTGQLRREFLEFSLQRTPEAFLFLWTSAESHKTVPYSAAGMNDFLGRCLQLCRGHSELFEETWRRIL